MAQGYVCMCIMGVCVCVPVVPGRGARGRPSAGARDVCVECVYVRPVVPGGGAWGRPSAGAQCHVLCMRVLPRSELVHNVPQCLIRGLLQHGVEPCCVGVCKLVGPLVVLPVDVL